MGQRMPDEPIEYGDDCAVGWPAGKTPKYVYARFSLMEKCPDPDPPIFSTPPNDRVFKLTQKIGHPCDWVYDGDPWYVTFEADAVPLFTTLTLSNIDDLTSYFQDQPAQVPDEGFVFHNTQIACPGWFGAHKGIAVVTWTPQATAILKSINMEKAADLFMELWPLDNGKLVYKFCRISESTNIKILFEP